MDDVLQRPGGPQQVEIRAVEVITGRRRSVTLSSVRCPVRARTSPVEECAHCGQSAGIAQDVLSRGEWVCCDASAVDGRATAWTPVRAVIPRTAVAVRPGLAASTACAALRARGQPGAPVVDGEGRPVGWVSEVELLRARAGAKVSDVMGRGALAVAEGAPLERAAALLVSHGRERLPVVSSDGVVVGVLSALDVVGWLAPAPDGGG